MRVNNIRQGYALGGIVLLVLITSLLTGHQVPFYDGIANPDEPYRYVQPPKTSLKTASPPSSANQTVELQNGKSTQYLILTSSEYGPQVTVYFDASTLNAPSQASTMNIYVKPLAPDSNAPKDGTLAGNIYRFGATSNSGTVVVNSVNSRLDTIDLRLPQGYPVGATAEYRNSPQSTWTDISTTRIGNDIYEAPIIGFGDYALISNKSATGSKQSGSSIMPAVISIVSFVIVAGVVVIIIRSRSNTKFR